MVAEWDAAVPVDAAWLDRRDAARHGRPVDDDVEHRARSLAGEADLVVNPRRSSNRRRRA